MFWRDKGWNEEEDAVEALEGVWSILSEYRLAMLSQ